MNRNLTVGKKIEGILVSICLLFIFLNGCGEASMQNGTNLELEKDGGITVTYIEEFPSDYYDINELIQMNEEEVKAYNSKVGREAVEIISTETDGAKVTMKMHYKDADDYGSMNGGAMFHGTVEQGVSSGYNLESTYLDVKTGESVTTMDWNNLAEHHLVVVKGSHEEYTATIHTYNKIVYATENVTVSEDGRTANVSGMEQSVIVFK